MIRQNRYGGQYMRRFAPQTPSAPQAEEKESGRMALAMAYLADQRFEELYEPAEALSHGTLFKELDMPFHGCFRI